MRGQARGHLALKSAQSVFPEGSLIFLWCFVFYSVSVSQGLGVWKLEQQRLDLHVMLLEYSLLLMLSQNIFKKLRV